METCSYRTSRRERRLPWRLLPIGLTIAVLALAPGFSGAAKNAGTGTPQVRDSGKSTGAEAYFRFAMAKLAQQRQDFGAAVSFLKEAAEADPDSALIRAELAATYLRVRDYPAAEQAANEALAIDPQDALAHRVLAQLYYSRARRGMDPEANTRLAMEELEASLGGDENDDPETLLTLGRFYYETGEFQKAVDTLKRFVDVQANPSPSSLFLLARGLMQLERYGDAESVLRQILLSAPDWLQVLETLVRVTRVQGKFDESIEPLRRILQIQGGDATTYNQLGDAYFRTGRYEEASEMFEMASREDPTSPYSLYYLALSQENLGRTEQARAAFQKMLERDPDNGEVLFRLGRLAERQGATEEAIGFYRRLVASLEKIEEPEDPRRDDIDVFCGRVAVLMMELERYDDAVKQVSWCLERTDGPSASLDLLMIRALLFDGKTERALGQARRAARAFEDDPRFLTVEAEVLLQSDRQAQGDQRLAELLEDGDVTVPGMEEPLPVATLVSDAYFNAGALAERRGELERAERLLAKAIEINPENGAALNYLGYLWADAGRRLEEAVDLIRRALAVDPENGAYLDSLGWAYHRQGRHEDAREQLRLAVEKMSADATIHEHLGDVEAASGNDEGAVRHWRRALDLNPDDPEAIRRKIEKAAPASRE